ncbi:MAG TPA: HNH endonuclease [Flavihumibacter sp.]
MAQCYACGTTLNRLNSSWEHILPSAIGGTLKSKRLLCQYCNKKAGNRIDRVLTGICRPYIAFYKTQPDRRNRPEKIRAIQISQPEGSKDKENLLHAAVLKIFTNFLMLKWKRADWAAKAANYWMHPSSVPNGYVQPISLQDKIADFVPYHSIELKASAKEQTITGELILFGELGFRVMLCCNYDGADQVIRHFQLLGAPSAPADAESA